MHALTCRNKPHTSGTALCTHVCMVDRPLNHKLVATYRGKYMKCNVDVSRSGLCIHRQQVSRRPYTFSLCAGVQLGTKYQVGMDMRRSFMWKLTLCKKSTEANYKSFRRETLYFPEFTATRKGLHSLHCLSDLLYNVTCIQRSHMQLTGISLINWTGQVHPGPPLATPLPMCIAGVSLHALQAEQMAVSLHGKLYCLHI